MLFPQPPSKLEARAWLRAAKTTKEALQGQHPSTHLRGLCSAQSSSNEHTEIRIYAALRPFFGDKVSL